MASTKTQNRKDVEASRERDRKAGIVRVEVRIPAVHRVELLKLCSKWRKEANKRLSADTSPRVGLSAVV